MYKDRRSFLESQLEMSDCSLSTEFEQKALRVSKVSINYENILCPRHISWVSKEPVSGI